MTSKTHSLRRGPFLSTLRFLLGAYPEAVLPLLLLSALAVSVVVVRVADLLVERTTPAPVIVLTATPALALAATPEAEPIAVSGVPTLPADVSAFAAPAGVYLGNAPAGSAYTIVGRTAEGWTLLMVSGLGGYDGAGSIWVRPEEAPEGALLAQLLITPVPTPPPAVVYIQPAAPPAAAPAPAPEPVAPTPRPCDPRCGGMSSGTW